MKTLFINGSPNKDGNTVKLTKQFLINKNYETINLVDYKIYDYGQKFNDDQFEEVVKKMSEADEIIRKLNTEQRNYLNRYFAHACLE